MQPLPVVEHLNVIKDPHAAMPHHKADGNGVVNFTPRHTLKRASESNFLKKHFETDLDTTTIAAWIKREFSTV